MNVDFGDVERITVDYLKPLAAAWDTPGPANVGVELPDDWTTSSRPFVGIACDLSAGTWPITSDCTVRVTAWAGSPTAAKRLARIAENALLNHPTSSEVWGVGSVTGPIAAKDPDNRAPIASFSVAVQLKPAAA